MLAKANITETKFVKAKSGNATLAKAKFSKSDIANQHMCANLFVRVLRG